MGVDIAGMDDDVRKLRKSLKQTRKQLTPTEVHKLRTRVRRFEAAAEALPAVPGRRAARLLPPLARIRKKAGRVRDMDVLTAHLATAHANGDQECVVQLFEHLGAERHRQAGRLRKLVRKQGPRLRKRLKRVSSRIGKLASSPAFEPSGELPTHAADEVLRLSGKLARPASLNRGNLHEFRLKIRALRDILQMAGDHKPGKLVEMLSECKDAIGEWHDWEELIAIGGDVLDHGRSCPLLAQLKTISARKFRDALSLANKVRNSCVETSDRKNAGRPAGRPAQPMLKGASAFAA